MLQEASVTSMHIAWEDFSLAALSGVSVASSGTQMENSYELHLGIVNGPQAESGESPSAADAATELVCVYRGNARGCMLSGLDHCTSYRCVLFEAREDADSAKPLVDDGASVTRGKGARRRRKLCSATFSTLPLAPVRLSSSRVVCIGSLERSVELSFEFPDVACTDFVLEGRCIAGSRRNMPVPSSTRVVDERHQEEEKSAAKGSEDSGSSSSVAWQHVRFVGAASRKVALEGLVANNIYEFRICARNLANAKVCLASCTRATVAMPPLTTVRNDLPPSGRVW